MTSKSPVRSCEDVDATALSFAEIDVYKRQAYDKEMAQDAMRNAVYNDYNDVKAAHPDEIVLYQVCLLYTSRCV